MVECKKLYKRLKGFYWHKDKQKDEERQQTLENEGWLFLRYKDKIPTKQELLKEINYILGGIK